MYTFGIILIMVAIFLLIEMIRQLVKTEDARWVFMLLAVGAVLTIGAIFVAEEPTDRDVINGRAHYVTVTHEDYGRTIITYDIEWNNKTIHPW
jgi:1,4-dihydroxy-2-naphthoate octaprenyltransferase